MVLHAAIIGAILYASMLFLGVASAVAEDRSVVLAAFILIYMVFFGHQLPVHGVNKNLAF